jgi:hypothetical protein
MARAWLDTWSGVKHVVDAMHDAGYNMRFFQSRLSGGRSSAAPLRRDRRVLG